MIFNLAGQVSHIDSMRDPYTDLEINCRAQLSILEACRANNPGVRVVYAGTRQVYGRPEYLPVDERHLVRPADINGVNKAAGEYYHLLYNNVFGVPACSLRLTNVYGPRQLVKHNRQGFIGWFIRLAIENREIQILAMARRCADFRVCRDAADAFLRAGASDACDGGRSSMSAEPNPSAIAISCLAHRHGRSGRVRYVAGPLRRSGSTSAASILIQRNSRHASAGRRGSHCAKAHPHPRVLQGTSAGVRGRGRRAPAERR